MNGFSGETFTQSQTAPVAEGNVEYSEGYTEQPAEAAAPDTSADQQQGFSIPTTGQTTGGGPMRQGRGNITRFNPMSRGRPQGGVGDQQPASAAMAEKNELGFIIFAYNIGYQTDESQLNTLFSPYGTVAKINVIQDFSTGMNKGYAFITMPNQTEAETAVNELNGSNFNGNTLQVRFKSPKGQGPPPGIIRGGRGNMRARGMHRGGQRGMARGVGYRGARGMGRGMQRGRGRGAYSSAPSAYDYAGYSYDPYGYADYGYSDYADPYAGYGAPGSGYASYGAAGW